ncbi:hypothetical protein C1E23_13260 [Pseudoalteromonas phenolica]|uniref:Pyrrolo-quinoline quinone repeat domain-containing protein n=1 Tax=Pseudoalteromonas phenolica TaxID=161398 RepID=A0A4Q7IKB9_9GAMM|nr:RHS repeat-associated core domain-containing protein [Pseudoalteromonas phenolica]RZQ52623.1 hypothetical protein C1E23_13260 [Pseudoalteromonas phenolica]
MKNLLITANLMAAISFAQASLADEYYPVSQPNGTPVSQPVPKVPQLSNSFASGTYGIGDEVCPIPNLLNQYAGIEKVNALNCGDDNVPPTKRKQYVTCDLTSDITTFKNEPLTVYFQSTTSRHYSQIYKLWAGNKIYAKQQNYYFDNIKLKTIDNPDWSTSFQLRPNKIGTFTASLKNSINRQDRNDTYVQTDTCSRTVHVIEKTKPSVSSNAPSHTVYQGAKVNISFTAEDAANDITKFEVFIDGVKQRGKCQSNTSCSFKHTAKTSVGSYYIKATATDQYGLSSSKSVKIKVKEENRPPEAKLYVKNKNQSWVNSRVANPNDSLQFKLVASDVNSQRSNKIKEIKFCKTAGYSECVSISLSNCEANGNKTTYTCFFEEKFGDSNQTFTAYAKDNTSQSAGNDSNKVVVTKNIKPNVNLTISNGSQFMFTNEQYTINLASTDSDIRSARICKFPGHGFDKNAPPKNCSGTVAVKNCSINNGRVQSCSWNKNSPDNQDAYHYYAYIEDQHGLAEHGGLNISVMAPFGVRIKEGSISSNKVLGENLSFKVQLGGLTSKSHNLTDLTLKAGQVAVPYSFTYSGRTYNVDTTGKLSSEIALPTKHDGSTRELIELNASWQTTLSGQVSLSLIAKAGGRTTNSATHEVIIAPPIPSSVTSITIEDKGKGIHHVTRNSVAHATSYNWVGFKRDNTNSSFIPFASYENQAVTELTKSFSLTDKSDHGKQVKYCIVAVNSTGSSAQACSNILTVHNPEPVPNRPLFSSSLKHSYSAAYDVSWSANTDSVTTKYKLLGWQGTNADKPASPTVIYDGELLKRRVASPSLGNFTYQLQACNSQGACIDGELRTVNHQRALISKVTESSACPTHKDRCLAIEGVGLSNQNGRLDIRLKLNAEVYTVSTVGATQVNDFTLAVNVNQAVINGFNEGGLTIRPHNGISYANKGLFHVHADAPNGHLDPINNPMIATKADRVYTTQGREVVAFDINYSQQWAFEANGDVTTPAVLEKQDSLNRWKDTLFFGSKDNHLYSVNFDGNEIWRMSTRGEISATPQISDQGELYVGSHDQALYSVDQQSGAVLWSYQFPYPVTEQVTLVGEDIYVSVSAEKTDPSDIGETVVYILDRDIIGANALRWDQINGDATSALRDLLESTSAGWQPDENHPAIQTLTRLYVILFDRAPSKEELTFMAFAYSHGINLNEIINALLTSEELVNELPGSMTNLQFVQAMEAKIFPSGSPSPIAGKTIQQWADALSTGTKRADLIEAWLNTSESVQTQSAFVYRILFYFYGYCYVDTGCDQNKTADSDNDGVSDYIEVYLGTDPFDARDGLKQPHLQLVENSNVNETPERGVITLSLTDFDENIDYVLVEGLNRGNSRKELSYGDTQTLKLTRPNGTYSYQVKACYNVTIDGEQLSSCSSLSNTINVDVSNSLNEARLNPIRPESYELASKPYINSDHSNQAIRLSSTPGTFKVSEGGAATYHIPISLPAGISGNTPEVSLAYTSQAPMSSLGQGWSLNAASSVTRCRQTFAQDGQFRAMSFDEQSRYCIDGQRLILKSGEEGQIDAVYVTETETFSEIKIVNHPETAMLAFRVKSKDGSTKYYGGADDAVTRLDPYDVTSPVVSWMLSSIYDNLSHGDVDIISETTAITYHYGLADDATADSSTETLLKHIQYSGNRIEFDYEIGPVRSSGYMFGVNQRQSALLTKISVFNHKSESLRHYKLGFEDHEHNNVRQLKRVEECVGLNSSTCRKPITFEYNDFNTDLSFQASQDLAWSEKVAHTYVDILGNGRPALATITRSTINDKSYTLCLNDNNGLYVCDSFTRNDRSDYVPMLAVDYDNDGKQSLWINMRDSFGSNSDHYWLEFYLDGETLNTKYLPLEKTANTGGGGGGGGGDVLFGNEVTQQDDLHSIYYTTDNYMTDIRLADVNGDGHADIIHRRGDKSKYFFVRYWKPSLNKYSAKRQITNEVFSRNNYGRLFSRSLKRNLDNDAFYTLDFNFDGLTDILALTCVNKCNGPDDVSGFTLYLNTITPGADTSTGGGNGNGNGNGNGDGGGNFDPIYPIDPLLGVQQSVNSANTTGLTTYFKQVSSRSMKLKHLMPMDVNGDGLTDLVYYNKDRKRWIIELNKSRSTSFYRYSLLTDFTEVDILYDSDGDIRPIFADLDRDGKVEMFHEMGAGHWTKLEWDPVREKFLTTNSSIQLPEFDPKEGEGVYFADYNFDGISDLIYYGESGIKVKLNYYERAEQGLLSAVVQGHGIRTDIEYGLMNNGELYDKGAGEATVASSDLMTQTLISPMPLVSQVTTAAPTINSLDEQVSVRYNYGGYRVQFGGRGALGFAELTTTTEKDGYIAQTTTQYHQNFPLVGMPKSTVKYIDNEMISYSTNDYFVKENPRSNSKSYQVYNSQSTDCQAIFDFDSDGNWSTSEYGCAVVDNLQDNFGNTTRVTNRNYTLSSATQDVLDFADKADKSEHTSNSTSVTVSEFGTTAQKKLGRLQNTEVTKTQGNESHTTRAEFEYYSSGTKAGMLWREKVVLPQSYDVGELDRATLECNTELTTEHTYDAFGNTTNVSTYPTNRSSAQCDNLTARQKVTTYSTGDDAGRYVATKGNARFTTSTVVSRNKFGQPTEVRNVDGVSSYTYYNNLGATVGSFNATGQQSKVVLKTCDSDYGYCAYIRESYVNTSLVSKEYVDVYERVYKKVSFDAMGKEVVASKVYDKFGRVISEQVSNLAATENRYNVFDQLVYSNDVNAGVESAFSRVGYTETVTVTGDLAAGAQTTTTTYDIYGRVEEVTDNDNQTLTYAYDIRGNQLSVTSSADNQIVMETEYDYLGRKIKTIDKDAGTWEYRYNAFGQLVWQKDAIGNESNVYYDSLGRKQRQSYTGESSDSTKVYKSGKPYQLDYEQMGQWRRTYFYDTFGRAIGTVTDLESSLNCAAHVAVDPSTNDLRIQSGSTAAQLYDPALSRCVITQTVFDEYGRAVQQFDDYRRKVTGEYVDARGTRIIFENQKAVARVEAREGEYGIEYYRVTETNDLGQVTRYQKGAQSIAVTFDSQGRLTGKAASDAHLLAESYKFDGAGNLTEKDGVTYGYDSLNRLTTVGGEVRYGYTGNGNLTSKDGWTQHYNEAGTPLHAISSRTRFNSTTNTTEEESFEYDANGNQTKLFKNNVLYRDVTYSARNKVTEITSHGENGETVKFSYDANNSRFKREDNEQTVYYAGALELTTTKDGGHKVIKRYIGNDAIQTYDGKGLADLKWLFTNYQGSIVAITNNQYQLLQRFSYDAFGKQTQVEETDLAIKLYYASHIANSAFTHIYGNLRGYTGHESLKLGNDNRVIHMNGRIYDSSTGRFMQADPFTQAPKNLQNYNRYSYVLNNPMSYTDPSGYIFKKLGKLYKKYWQATMGSVLRAIAKVPLLNAAVQIGIGIACQGAAAACLAIYNGAQTYAVTGSAKAALTSAAISYASAQVFQKIGGQFTKTTGGFFDAGVKNGFRHIVSHALAGGVISKVQGGKFGHGFFSAGLTKGLTPHFENIGGFDVGGYNPAEAIVAGILGGTISKATGGKFGNAAMTAAMANLFNNQNARKAAKEYARKMTEKYAALYKGRKDYHDYEVGPHLGCLVGESSCSLKAIRSIVENHSAPFNFSIFPPSEGRHSLLNSNPIIHTTSGDFSFNITEPGHRYHDGMVVHLTYESDGAIWYYTRGVGTTFRVNENTFFGTLIFMNMHGDVHNQIQTDIYGQNPFWP